jgi:hypothetical protein
MMHTSEFGQKCIKRKNNARVAVPVVEDALHKVRYINVSEVC